MSEELNKKLEIEVTEGVKKTASVEIVEDYAAELEAPYKTLNQGHIEIIEEESGEGKKWVRFTRMMGGRTVIKAKITEAVKSGVVTSPEEVRAFIPTSQLSTRYVEKLENWQGKYVKAVTIMVDPEKKRLVLSGCEMEKGKKEVQKREHMAQFKTGDIMEGTVDSVKSYGASTKPDGGVDGLLHASQISTQRVKHPSTVSTEGQIIEVKILSA